MDPLRHGNSSASHRVVAQHHVVQHVAAKKHSSKAPRTQKSSFLKETRVVTWWLCFMNHNILKKYHACNYEYWWLLLFCFEALETMKECTILPAKHPNLVQRPAKHHSKEIHITQIPTTKCENEPLVNWNNKSPQRFCGVHLICFRMYYIYGESLA